jgi:hypothetical protein
VSGPPPAWAGFRRGVTSLPIGGPAAKSATGVQLDWWFGGVDAVSNFNGLCDSRLQKAFTGHNFFSLGKIGFYFSP